MFKSALTPSLVGFTVRQPQTTLQRPPISAAPPRPAPAEAGAVDRAPLCTSVASMCVMLHAFDAPHLVHAGRRILDALRDAAFE